MDNQPTRTCCIAHRTLLNVMWQPGRERSLGAESLCCSPETMSMLYANWLYPNTKKKKLGKNPECSFQQAVYLDSPQRM